MVVESSARLPGSAKRVAWSSSSGMRLRRVTPTKKGRVKSGPWGRLAQEARRIFEQGEGVLAGGEAGLHAPAGVADSAEVLFRFCDAGGLVAGELIADGDVHGGGVEVFHAEAHGGLVEELVGDGPGAFGGAVLGRHDVGVAEGFLDAGVDGRAVVSGDGAAEPVIETVAPDGVPEGVHGGTVEGEKLLHGANALGVEADFGAGADAGKIAEFEMGDGAGELRGEQADEAVGLLHVAGDFGEVAVGRHADGAAEGFADVRADGLLDLEGDGAGAGRFLLAAHELADHLIDGRSVGDGAATFDRFRDAVGIFGIDAVVAFDEDDGGTDAFGFADLGSGFDAEGLGFVAGGDAAGGVGVGGDDGEGAVAVFGVKLLLDGGKEAVEVDVQEGEAVGLRLIRHARSSGPLTGLRPGKSQANRTRMGRPQAGGAIIFAVSLPTGYNVWKCAGGQRGGAAPRSRRFIGSVKKRARRAASAEESERMAMVQRAKERSEVEMMA